MLVGFSATSVFVSLMSAISVFVSIKHPLIEQLTTGQQFTAGWKEDGPELPTSDGMFATSVFVSIINPLLA